MCDWPYHQEKMVVPSEELALKLARGSPPADKREAMRDQGRLPKPGQGPSE